MPLERSASLTVGAYLENWVTVTLPARVAAGQLKDSTLGGYRDTVTHHLLPGLGRYPLASLSPQHLRAWQSAKLTDRSVHGRPLSSSSVKSYHAVLRSALSDAMRDELVDRNVAMLVRPGPSPSATLTGAEAGALLAAVTADPLRLLWLVLLVLGLRKGEALALRWEDVDLDRRRLAVRRSLRRTRGELDPDTGRRRGRLVESSPKTAASAARLVLPVVLVDALQAHRTAQAAARLQARKWVDPGLVFTTPIGTWLEPRNINRSFAQLCEAAGIVRHRVHDLRHTAGSLLPVGRCVHEGGAGNAAALPDGHHRGPVRTCARRAARRRRGPHGPVRHPTEQLSVGGAFGDVIAHFAATWRRGRAASGHLRLARSAFRPSVYLLTASTTNSSPWMVGKMACRSLPV